MIKVKKIENENQLLKSDIKSLENSYLGKSSELTSNLAQINDSFRYEIALMVRLKKMKNFQSVRLF